MKPSLVAALGVGAAVPTFGLFLRYRQDLKAARARLAAVERHVVSTQWGAVEYTQRGSGDDLLVVHGIFHNCVGGPLSVRDLCPNRRVMKHLVLLVGNLPKSPTAVVQPSWVRLTNRQLPMWALKTFAPSTMARLVSAVPEELAITAEDARFVTEFIDSLFPVVPEGYDFDACVSNADVNDYNLEAISVPTLIVHTRDDRLASHEASKRAAGRIPGARFVSLESGGHLMLGQTKIVRDELADFFAERTERPAELVAS